MLQKKLTIKKQKLQVESDFVVLILDGNETKDELKTKIIKLIMKFQH